MAASPPPDISVMFRRGTPADTRACHELLWLGATELGRRLATPFEGTADDWWQAIGPVHALLEDAAEWWVAEDASTSQLVGYARSIERGGLFELTELFVRPDRQAHGIGRALLERAFPLGRGEVRVIVATPAHAALSSYYRMDTVARFPFFSLKREPVGGEVAGRLAHIGIADTDGLEALRTIESDLLGYPRGPEELKWLATNREVHLFRDGDRVTAFACIGPNGAGPIGALDPVDLPQVLATVDRRARELGLEALELEVPGPNEVAMRHLLGAGFRIDGWINFLMSNKPFGKFDRFIGFSPQIFL